MANKVPKTRNANTQTESAYWGGVRSALRRAYRYWKPATKAKEAARRPNQSDNKRMKWEFQCAHCQEWFPDKQVQIDHITPVGTLRCSADLAGFLERLTPEGGFQVLCKECHQVKTNEERGINPIDAEVIAFGKLKAVAQNTMLKDMGEKLLPTKKARVERYREILNDR